MTINSVIVQLSTLRSLQSFQHKQLSNEYRYLCYMIQQQKQQHKLKEMVYDSLLVLLSSLWSFHSLFHFLSISTTSHLSYLVFSYKVAHKTII